MSTHSQENFEFNMITEIYYKYIIAEDLILKQNYKTIMQIPRIKKIVLNISSKFMIFDKNYMIPALLGLEIISGKKLKITKAKKSIATFKLRKNQVSGCKVTLRSFSKIIFFEKLIKLLLPRFSGFRGINSLSFDNNGNFNLGIHNCFMFGELENYFDYFQNVSGINVSFQTTSMYNKFSYSGTQALHLCNRKARLPNMVCNANMQSLRVGLQSNMQRPFLNGSCSSAQPLVEPQAEYTQKMVYNKSLKFITINSVNSFPLYETNNALMLFLSSYQIPIKLEGFNS